MLRQHEIQIRVRYQETDGQARVHHANYFTYFELARTEILRASGMSYRQVEEAGYHLVVAEIGCEYFLPANFDDVLTLRTTVVRVKGASNRTPVRSASRRRTVGPRPLGRGLHRPDRQSAATAELAGSG